MAASIPTPSSNCATTLNLTAKQPGSFSNIETALTAAEASATVVWDISMIAYSLLLADVVAVPLLPFISLGYAVYELVNIFGGGKPKFQDTNNVIAAYNQSAYWPLHALASDLQIAANNGAPISDSNPAIQAQFSAWKLGTIESIQQLAGWPAGQQSPGFWQLQRLINQSWVSSRGTVDDVLHVVKAIDRYAEILACLLAQVKANPPPPNPPPNPGPTPTPLPNNCVADNPNTDEVLDLCNNLSFQLSEIYNQIINGFTGLAGQSNDACCAAVIQAIGQITRELTVIATALAHASKNQQLVDLTPLVTQLVALVTAVNAYPPALQACCNAVTNQLGAIANAISSQKLTDTTGIVDQLKQMVGQGDVDQFIFDALQKEGLISPNDLQTLQGLKWSDAIAYITSSHTWRTIEKAGHHIQVDYNALDDWVAKYNGAADNWVAKKILSALTTERNLLQTPISKILTTVKSAFQPTGAKVIAQIGVNPDKILADVAAVELNVEVLAGLVGLANHSAGERISKLGEYATALLGLEELREVQLGPLVQYGVARVAEMQAKKLYSQELPGATALAGLASRGLITNQQYFSWVPYTGLPGELWEQERQAAYRGLNPRQMLRLIETGLFSNAEIGDELTFGGLRPVSQARMLHAAPYLATQPERRQLIGTLEKAYTAGLLDDPTLTSSIDSAEQNTDRNNLILTRAKYEVLITESKALEAEYTTMFLGGVINDQVYRSYLGGIGLQPWMVNLVAGKAEARANATLQKQQLRDAAALQRATAAEERKAAMLNFIEGNTNLAALVAALILTGLTPTQAAAWADLATLQKAGRLRWIFGLQLTPQAAVLLADRVKALTTQRKKEQISDAEFVAALQALNIPPNYINALQAAADASLAGKGNAFGIPVLTT
jgi:hypothetical protein